VGAAAACVVLYAVAVVWLTWPLAAHLATHLPDTAPGCRFDTLFTGWLLAYESHRLITDPLALAQANIYAPTPDALFYGPTCASAVPLFAPLYLATGHPALGLNALLLGGAALTAAMLHLVVRHWTGSHAAGAVAGATLLSNRWLLWELSPTAPIYALLFGFPLLLLLLAHATPSRRRTALLVPATVGQALVHFGYIAPSVLGPMTLLAAVRLADPRTRRAGAHLTAVVAVAALALVPELLAYRAVQRANPNLVEQTVWRGLGQPPTALPAGLVGHQMPTAVAPLAFALIAVGGALALVRSRRRPDDAGLPRHAWRQAAFWAVAGTAISLTPTVELFGRDVVTPKAWLIGWLPFLGRLRVPARLSLGAYVALGALAGLAFAEIARRIAEALRSRRPRLPHAVAWGLCAALVASMYVQYARGFGRPHALRQPLPEAYPLARAIDGRSPLLAILRQPGGPLLELPVGPTGLLPHWQTRAMYRSIFHWRRLVNGYASYWPEAFPEHMRLALALPEPKALAALRDATGLEMVLVHAGELDEAERGRWLAAAAAGRDDLRLVARDGDDLLLAVASSPAPTPARRPP
jgi:hypothetical protein